MRTSTAETLPAHQCRPAIAAQLDALAHRVSRLKPDRHDPEKYFVERSEIEFALRQLALAVSPFEPDE
jgi:hypothetical protein